MKKAKYLLGLLFAVLFCFALVACGSGGGGGGGGDDTDKLKDITGVTFTDVSVEYDGQEHEITVTGTLPAGVSVAYTNNKGTDTGTYNATATLTGDGYNPLTLTATLTIRGRDITGVSFTDKTVTYNKAEQTIEITVAGSLPEGVSVAYTNNKGTDAGTYNATATLTGTGYNPLTLTAKLTVEKAPIDTTHIVFNDLTVTYNGEPHTLTAEGLDSLPEGVTSSYSENSLTDAGELTVTLTLDGGKNYISTTLTKKLTVEKAEFTGLTFADESFSYDGMEHSIVVTGAVPADSTVVYSREGVSTGGNVATATGTYEVTVTITNKNYVTYTATATLRITASEDERAITYFNGTLYFANARHNDYLYSYNGDTLTKVSSDIPYDFTVMGNTLYYRNGSLLSSSVKKIGTTSGTDFVAGVKAEYLCSDGDHLYYVVNGLTKEKSGIYSLDDPMGSSPSPVLISQGKAKYLTFANGKLWFADGNNGWKLSSVPTGGANVTRTVVPVGDKTEGEKIAALTVSEHGGTDYLFFTVDNLLGNYIANYNTVTGESKKLSVDAGSNLTVVGNDLYYINVDLVTSSLFGKGIYRVNAYPVTASVLPGTKVIGDEAGTEKYSSLCSLDDGRLAYYEVNTQDLCLYTLDGGATERLLTNFVAPKVYPIIEDSKIVVYGTRVYYLDLYNGKALYYIDTAAAVKTPIRVTSEKVADFSILGDVLYFNTVSWGVNNSLYKVNLKLGGTPELVSESDCRGIVTDGESIFYILHNMVGVATAIHKIDGSGADTEIYSKGVSGLTYYEGYLYFLDGGCFMKTPVTAMGDGDAVVVDDQHNYDMFVISDGVVYFREMYLGETMKRLSRINVDGTEYRIMMEKDTDPIEIVVHGGRVYYYNDLLSTAKSGIYSVSINAAEKETPELLLAHETADEKLYYYARYLTLVGDKFYFVNYSKGYGSDSHLYSVELGGSHAVEKLA